MTWLSCLLQQGIGLPTSSLARGTKNASVFLHTPPNGRGSSRRDLSRFQKLQRSLSVHFLLRNFLEVGPCPDSALVLGVNKPGWAGFSVCLFVVLEKRERNCSGAPVNEWGNILPSSPNLRLTFILSLRPFLLLAFPPCLPNNRLH